MLRSKLRFLARCVSRPFRKMPDAFSALSPGHGVRRRRRAGSSTAELLESRTLLSAVYSLLQDSNEVPAQAMKSDDQIFDLNGQGFFIEQSSLGPKLMRVDPVAESVAVVFDFGPSRRTTTSQFGRLGDSLYFVLTDVLRGHQLWKSDGTANGTSLVRQISDVSAGA